jgi:ABC transport system ATP-binding/permease protein
MPLLTLKDVSLSFGGPPLFENLSLEINDGERICLLGRNGEGKSSLMKVITGEIRPDTGEVHRQAGASFAFLQQEIPADLRGPVGTFVEGGDEHHHDWERHIRAEKWVQRLGLSPEADAEALSAGLKRRVALARELVEEPSLILLDEPTNHLDLEAILWLEKFLRDYPGALLFVTHDRRFLQTLATRILELDRGRLTSWSCDYETFLRRREEQLEAEAKQQAAFDRKLAQEEAWLRQGIKARRTRNEGRVRALKAMREERRARREQQGRSRFQLTDDDRSGEKVIVTEGLSFAYDSLPVVRNLSTRIMRGDRVGILGPNGAGKTTLLNLLLGRLNPQEGSVTFGTNLTIAYFDQLREQLDGEKTVQENVAGDQTEIDVQGKKRHIISYLQDFLFSPERARSKVRSLSGGERNRLLLARLFTRPSNLLVLDEPTNDLDMETLELLEERLMEYNGTLLLVSHDRSFLNNVVTQLLVFEGDGRVVEYLGGYDDYLRHRPADTKTPAPASSTSDSKPAANAAPGRKSRPRKFLNRERRELEELPVRIEALEAEQEKLSAEMANPAVYQNPEKELVRVKTRLDDLHRELENLYQRWQELERLRSELEG